LSEEALCDAEQALTEEDLRRLREALEPVVAARGMRL
jgi:3-deoxy-D-arabino-heptulosonate 7-phosphate (DAHP) synthase